MVVREFGNGFQAFELVKGHRFWNGPGSRTDDGSAAQDMAIGRRPARMVVDADRYHGTGFAPGIACNALRRARIGCLARAACPPGNERNRSRFGLQPPELKNLSSRWSGTGARPFHHFEFAQSRIRPMNRAGDGSPLHNITIVIKAAPYRVVVKADIAKYGDHVVAL